MAFIYFISNIFVIKFYVRNAHTSETHFARSMRTAAVKYTELTCKDPVSCQSPDHPAQSNTATSSRDFLKWWKWESIGAEMWRMTLRELPTWREREDAG
jgi:hypothetical protein